jgi:hypothetical protein
MRLTLSKGQLNIYTLAKNAGTSVDQIETILCSAPAAINRARSQFAELRE